MFDGVINPGAPLAGGSVGPGVLVVNGDDWGRDRLTTDRILECSAVRAISSNSAMVFMEDSDRAAELARAHGIEAGLHLNFTTPFSARGCPTALLEREQRVARYLLWHRFAQVVFHPGLMQDFKYLVAVQLDEFSRLYGAAPERLDGHHHMHLCGNVRFQHLLPPGIIVRRNFSFRRHEATLCNRLYRKVVDRSLARRYRLADFFFSLSPPGPSGRLQRIYGLARRFVVELATHPACPEDSRYLAQGEIFRDIGDVRIGRPSAVLKWSGARKGICR